MTSRREIWHLDSSEVVAWVGGEGDQRDDRREIVDELCSTAAAPRRSLHSADAPSDPTVLAVSG
jgi:hypothetical protein